MFGSDAAAPPSPTGRRAARRAATQADILDAAWALARETGLTGWSMRDLGARVGLSAASLYGYFAGKHHIYDAMFGQGYTAFRAHMAAAGASPAGSSPHPRIAARAHSHAFFTFCVDDPVRFQLLFLRTIPGFEPSPERFAIAVATLEDMVARSAAIGIRSTSVDLWTAVLTGLASQQIANDPGGDRWQRLVDDAVDMLLAATTSMPDVEKGRTR